MESRAAVPRRLAAVGPHGTPEAILWGDEPALLALIETLRTIGDREAVVDLTDPPVVPRGDPVPALARLVISPFGGAIQVQGSGEQISITGSPSSLTELADYIGQFVEHNDLAEPGIHTHLWDHPRMPWIGPDTALEIAGWWP
jgi:hypothetical protein